MLRLFSYIGEAIAEPVVPGLNTMRRFLEGQTKNASKLVSYVYSEFCDNSYCKFNIRILDTIYCAKSLDPTQDWYAKLFMGEFQIQNTVGLKSDRIMQPESDTLTTEMVLDNLWVCEWAFNMKGVTMWFVYPNFQRKIIEKSDLRVVWESIGKLEAMDILFDLRKNLMSYNEGPPLNFKEKRLSDPKLQPFQENPSAIISNWDVNHLEQKLEACNKLKTRFPL